MYTENPAHDAWRIAKAFCSNQLARCAPSLYVTLTRQTGRGPAEETVGGVASYFHKCFYEYFEQLDVPRESIPRYLRGKAVLEYGPGDTLGVALLMYAYGARIVHCVDRFPLRRPSHKSVAIYNHLLTLMDGAARTRAGGAFTKTGVPESGFNDDAITYSLKPDGLSHQVGQYDLIISRAVLEHVHSLRDTIYDTRDALKAGGCAIHDVDLKSHGLDRYRTFDFLTWPESLYKLMYSHKGFPNRLRLDMYRRYVTEAGLRFRKLVPTGKVDYAEIDAIRQGLAPPFRHLSVEELSWTGFWMVVEHG